MSCLSQLARFRSRIDVQQNRGDEMKRILVNGAGGFIGGHMVKRLKSEGYWVRAVDIKDHDFCRPPADEFILGDLRDQRVVEQAVDGIGEVYQFAADMGGAGYIF